MEAEKLDPSIAVGLHQALIDDYMKRNAITIRTEQPKLEEIETVLVESNIETLVKKSAKESKISKSKCK